ncbi:unnamed protein product [Didymodactylos carnosus]|nr:unnamed protein product [Didymodactylos carnosus]CAF4500743.1 unnamed protein product [Didymodactylos carnosus]
MQNQLVRNEFKAFIGWLRNCGAFSMIIRSEPKTLNKTARLSVIEQRIANITDSKLTQADLWYRVHSQEVTRETRMEIVAWTAVCKFHCKLEGGFVRDWILAVIRQNQQI